MKLKDHEFLIVFLILINKMKPNYFFKYLFYFSINIVSFESTGVLIRQVKFAKMSRNWTKVKVALTQDILWFSPI